MSKCKCEKQGKCSGKVEMYFQGYTPLCKYHGELVAKLETMTLAQLEDLVKNSTWVGESWRRYPAHVEDARRLALCSDVADFHKHAGSVYDGTYDYTKH